MMKITFNIAVEHVLAKEGGYVNDPADSGGRTKYGISARAYPDLNIKALTREDAKAIYKRDYWDAVCADKLPDSLRLTVFDMAVNAGVSKAVQLLQQLAGIEQDGILGPITLSQAQHVGLEAYTKARKEHYRAVTISQPKNLRFFKGWINRANQIEKITKELVR